MGISIYAGSLTTYDGRPCWDPVIDFSHWDQTVLADDCDERDAAGLDPFIPNPNYIEDAGMNLSCYNAQTLFGLIGLDLGDEGIADFDIDTVQTAALKALNSDAASYTEAYQEDQRTTETEIVSLATGARETVTTATGPRVISFGIPDGYVRSRLEQLLRLIAKGRQHGATHICCS